MESEALKRWMEKRKKKTEPDDDFLIRLEELHIPVERIQTRAAHAKQ